MDSLPRELIDAIIDNLPRSSLRRASLVARRWRQRSQQSLFDRICFPSERHVNSWHTKTHDDPHGVSSYIQFARFYAIPKWEEPTLFTRVLENFNSLTTLWMYDTEIPHGLPGHISCGEFSKRITALRLMSPRCTFTVAISTILSFPNLKRLTFGSYGTLSGDLPPTGFATPQWGIFESLRLYGDLDEFAETFAKVHFVSRRLSLDIRIPCIQDLLMLSSEVMTELVLQDSSIKTRPPTGLLPFPALVSLCIDFGTKMWPSPQLIDALSSISSTPSLTSICISQYGWEGVERVDSDKWNEMDMSLARIARSTKVRSGLALTLKRWPLDKLVWEGFAHEFREVGGEIKTDPNGLDYF